MPDADKTTQWSSRACEFTIFQDAVMTHVLPVMHRFGFETRQCLDDKSTYNAVFQRDRLWLVLNKSAMERSVECSFVVGDKNDGVDSALARPHRWIAAQVLLPSEMQQSQFNKRCEVGLFPEADKIDMAVRTIAEMLDAFGADVLSGDLSRLPIDQLRPPLREA